MLKETFNICIVTPLPPPCGGISHWSKLIISYAQKCSNVHISLIDIAPRWRAINDITLWKRIIGGGTQLVRDCLRLIRLLCTKPIEVMHLITSGQFAIVRDVSFVLIAKALKIPVVYHIHFGRVPEIAGLQRLEWRLMAWVLKYVQTVIAIDRKTENTIRANLPQVKVEMVPNCVDLSALSFPQTACKSKRTALFIGWIVPSKGIAELIEAWSLIDHTDWQLQIIGASGDAYKRYLLEKFRTDGIELLGELPHQQAMHLLAEADLFVLPSYTEGFPNVVLEAMALKKPIIATHVGAIPEILDNGTCGFLIEPKDKIGLCNALELLMGDENMRKTIAGRAFERVTQNFSIERVFPYYMNIWRNAASSK